MQTNHIYFKLLFHFYNFVCCFFVLFTFTVTVEKIDLKGLSHKKNERNVECSFEVRYKVFFPFSPLRDRTGIFTMKQYFYLSK